MTRRIGGQNLEGRFFIISVPDDWTENDPLPSPSPEDRWFDRMTDFKAALDCPWIRTPVRYKPWIDGSRPSETQPRNPPASAGPPAGLPARDRAR